MDSKEQPAPFGTIHPWMVEPLNQRQHTATKTETRANLIQANQSHAFHQTLYRQTKVMPFTKRYILSDDTGLYITFDTAQEAFAWIDFYTPAAITNVRIEQ